MNGRGRWYFGKKENKWGEWVMGGKNVEKGQMKAVSSFVSAEIKERGKRTMQKWK